MKNRIIITSLFLCSLFFYNRLLANNFNEKSIVIYWDASLSLANKDIDKELKFLDTFLKSYPKSNIRLVTFNTSRTSDKQFTMSSSDKSLLYKTIREVKYDGASDFSLVDIGGTEDFLLFFTDGRNNLGSIKSKLYTPRIITISSVQRINKKFLHETAYYNKGYYVNLLEHDIEKSIAAIKENRIMPKLIFVSDKDKKSEENLIEGRVSNTEGNPLQDVYITIKGKNKSTITDQFGNYKILVKKGDVLVYSYTNMKTAEVITEIDNYIDVTLTKNVTDLDPVIIKSKSEAGMEMVLIGDRRVSRRSLGYAVNNITSDDITEANRTLGESMAGEFAGVRMGNNNDAGQMIIRGFSSFLLTNHPVFIVDGVQLSRSGVDLETKVDMNFIDPNIIADITVLKGLAATNRYGSLGNNGVVLITTKMASLKLKEKDKESNESNDIVYKSFTSPLNITKKQPSNFYLMLKKFESIDDSYNHYVSRLNVNKDNVSYFIESSSYFFDNNDQKKAFRVISNLLELFPEDTSVLRVLAFHLEKHGLLEYGEKIYRRILEISPKDSQNYLDLANNYFDNKKYQNSVDLFQKMSTTKIYQVKSFEGIKSQINNDFKSLLANRNQTWDLKKVKKSNFLLPKYKLRVVTEWSHPQTEFEIQYINPEKHFFTLSHTKETNGKTINNEINQGFLSDEYLLSELKSGKWFLNLTVPESQIPNKKYPKFLKVKVYTQFGAKNQKLQSYLINLDTINKNQIFASFTIN